MGFVVVDYGHVEGGCGGEEEEEEEGHGGRFGGRHCCVFFFWFGLMMVMGRRRRRRIYRGMRRSPKREGEYIYTTPVDRERSFDG